MGPTQAIIAVRLAKGRPRGIRACSTDGVVGRDVTMPLTRDDRVPALNSGGDAIAAHRASGVRPLRPDLLNLAQRGSQVGQPGVLVRADEAHAPGQRVAAAAGNPAIHEGIEYLPLALP
jgi:hypothetical protein